MLLVLLNIFQEASSWGLAFLCLLCMLMIFGALPLQNGAKKKLKFDTPNVMKTPKVRSSTSVLDPNPK